MSGHGTPPRLPGQRRRRAPPLRGDWIEIPATPGEVPPIPARGRGRGSWSSRTREAWRAWWRDPVSSQWTEGDRDLVLHLADLYEAWVRDERSSLVGEIRLLRDNLGLSPKGRQDRRWRVVEGELLHFPPPPVRKRTTRMRAIDPRGDSA